MYSFKSKFISLLLIFSMIISMFPVNSFAATNNEIIVHSCDPILGDSPGSTNILSKVSVENIDSPGDLNLGIIDPDIIVTTSSQTSIISSSSTGRYIGNDKDGIPFYIYSVNLNIPFVEKDSHYEYSFFDKYDRVIYHKPAYSPLYVFEPGGALYISDANVKEISESFAGETLPLSFFISGARSNVNKSNSNLKLLEDEVEVAEINSSDFAVSYSKKGEAQLAGNFTLPDSLDNTKEYAWEISMPEESGSSSSARLNLKVLDSGAPQLDGLDISGAITSSYMENHMQYGDSNSPPPFFTGKRGHLSVYYPFFKKDRV